MLIPVRPPQLSFEQRRGDVSRAQAIQGAMFRASYHLEVAGTGESTFDVNFPVAFSEYPGVYYGGALDDGQVLVDGSFPTCSVVVASWVTVVKNNHTYYIGAKLAIVTAGSATQIMIIHFHIEGKALQNPV